MNVCYTGILGASVTLLTWTDRPAEGSEMACRPAAAGLIYRMGPYPAL